MSVSAANRKPNHEQPFLAAKQFILDHDDFLVVSHVQPDGDAASSTCAMGWMLHKLGKRFVMMNEEKLPEKFLYLWGSSEVASFQPNLANRKFACVITVDCADKARVGRVSELFAKDAKILNIDHHATNDRFGDIAAVLPEAAATAEILHDFAKLFSFTWDKSFAECIYTGILTDTGGFRYSNTSPKVMEMAAALLSYGVKGHELAERLLEKLTMPHIRLLRCALNSLQFYAGGRIGAIQISLADLTESQAKQEDFEGIVNYPVRIDGVDIGLLFRETADGKVKVSFRSTANADVAEIAQQFGGGGHARAAGATVMLPLAEAVRQVVAVAERVLA
ncbi:MAG TPA: bifunctional oligoribonuclease/PAP phosphatase NrnA [Bacilli bacterium]